MASIHDEISRQFGEWEKQGRGWKVYSEPVRPEAAFSPFLGYSQLDAPDDGRRPTFLSSLYRKLFDNSSPPPLQVPTPPVEPDPNFYRHLDLVELRAVVPANVKAGKDVYASLFTSLSHCSEPLAFEIFGSHKEVTVQFACERDDLFQVSRQLSAHFPDVIFREYEDGLSKAWLQSSCDRPLIVEFGLAREFMFLLPAQKLDPFVGIIGALSDLQEDEMAVFQVLFQPALEDWREGIEASVFHPDGKPYFVNVPELSDAAKAKASQRLYAVVLRIGVLTDSIDRTVNLAHSIAACIAAFSHPEGNELVPLDNADYPLALHQEDLLDRNTHRAGMILTAEELMSLVHLPSGEVKSPLLKRDLGKTKAAPAITRDPSGVLLGMNSHAGSLREVRLVPEQRVRHMHVLGSSGTGKSTFLLNLIRQDIQNGQGVGILDPHGDLIHRILGIIPPERISDVVLVDLSDEDYSVGFNILSAHSDLEKRLLSSDLVGIFERLSTSWGDQMGSVLRNAILAFLESREGGTLSDLRRFLIEPAFRNRFLESVADPEIVYYWKSAFPQLTGNKSVGPVVTRLDDFLAPKPIRYMVSQRRNRLDFSEILDAGKIFLAKLPVGEMGEENSFLLGSLFVAKFQQAAMSRQRQLEANRRDFWLYIDEFPNFITPSMAEILSGARKYRVGLVLAHQDLGQLSADRKVASAVLSLPFTRVAFRLGDSDARALEGSFSFFEARDLQNLETGEAICKVEKSDFDFNLKVPYFPTLDPSGEEITRKAVIEASQKAYGTARNQLEVIQSASPVEASPKVIQPPAKPDNSKDAPRENKAPNNAAPSLPVQESPAGPSTNEKSVFQKAEQIKTKIIQEAGKLGFSYHEEKILANQQRIDLVLTRGQLTLACEISATTTAEHELGNIQKCLQHEYQRIFHICDDRQRREKILALLKSAVSAKEADRVQCVSCSEFLKILKSFPPSEPGEGTGPPSKSPPPPKGPTLNPEDQESEQERMLAELRRKLKRDKK